MIIVLYAASLLLIFWGLYIEFNHKSIWKKYVAKHRHVAWWARPDRIVYHLHVYLLGPLSFVSGVILLALIASTFS